MGTSGISVVEACTNSLLSSFSTSVSAVKKHFSAHDQCFVWDLVQGKEMLLKSECKSQVCAA